MMMMHRTPLPFQLYPLCREKVKEQQQQSLLAAAISPFPASLTQSLLLLLSETGSVPA